MNRWNTHTSANAFSSGDDLTHDLTLGVKFRNLDGIPPTGARAKLLAEKLALNARALTFRHELANHTNFEHWLPQTQRIMDILHTHGPKNMTDLHKKFSERFRIKLEGFKKNPYPAMEEFGLFLKHKPGAHQSGNGRDSIIDLTPAGHERRFHLDFMRRRTREYLAGEKPLSAVSYISDFPSATQVAPDLSTSRLNSVQTLNSLEQNFSTYVVGPTGNGLVVA